MKKTSLITSLILCGVMVAPSTFAQQGSDEPMSVFITSVGSGNGADLGGLAGADAHCQALASAVGRGDVTWHAYLSTQGPNAVNARDRIGSGPWYGQAGHRVAENLAHLHGDTLELARAGNAMNPFHVRTETGEFVSGVMTDGGPNEHDILTGSTADGRAYTDNADHTCSNWTSSADGEGSAQLGHHDRIGMNSSSWNSDHPSAGCSQPNLVRTGGAGLFYCFAID